MIKNKVYLEYFQTCEELLIIDDDDEHKVMAI